MAGLTLTIITSKATSLNYGETVGNVSILKKLSLGDSSQITFVSDKALKYDMKRKGRDEKGWKLLDEKLKEYIEGNIKDDKLDVDQFGKALIKDYQEFDLFGGLFTNLKTERKVKLSYGDSVKRVCPAKVTYAFSISKFSGDMNFINNIDAYNRYIKHIEDKQDQAIANSEEHTSHYLYTLTVDLDRVGVWEKEDGSKEEVLTKEEKAKRVQDLLDIIMTLDRQIRGRWENLSPVFVVGGVFTAKHPFFMDCVDAKEVEGRLWINVQRLKECVELVPEQEKVVLGVLSGTFLNEEELKSAFTVKTLRETFDELKRQVREYYGVS
ncbi:type I-B CRISPR-associated protein Cas7/Cst2/DevR [Hydrogenobacter hydrogenophilus]|uniref:CRISPR-associated autoregulator, Cst2 family n=1 Tax=Hydrogenobacter hydrogenophilus TaxID=35835 RepID=A0A285P4P7_9AQUI|nr:type I-B CRISPR-associated protein Cas7/Cst2/DevR [Hydrogenobacter hydrogenophilus]SNZ16143.1 CRISPR-associated autoregulator, Cst2 family [Hydrogenobacter hydrogenophilus]